MPTSLILEYSIHITLLIAQSLMTAKLILYPLENLKTLMAFTVNSR